EMMNMPRVWILALALGVVGPALVTLTLLPGTPMAAQPTAGGDPARGAALFQQCAACHASGARPSPHRAQPRRGLESARRHRPGIRALLGGAEARRDQLGCADAGSMARAPASRRPGDHHDIPRDAEC